MELSKLGITQSKYVPSIIARRYTKECLKQLQNFVVKTIVQSYGIKHLTVSEQKHTVFVLLLSANTVTTIRIRTMEDKSRIQTLKGNKIMHNSDEISEVLNLFSQHT